MIVMYKDIIKSKDEELKILTDKYQSAIDVHFHNIKLIETLNSEIKELIQLNSNLQLELEMKTKNLKRTNEEIVDITQELKDVKARQRKTCDNYEIQIEDQNKEMSKMRSELTSLRARINEVTIFGNIY